MERLFRYLEVPRFVPPALQTRCRQGALSPRSVGCLRRWVWNCGSRAVVGTFALAAAATEGPETASSAHAQLRYRFGLWNMRPGDSERLEASGETVAWLRAHFESDRVLLEELIGKPVPWAPVPEYGA